MPVRVLTPDSPRTWRDGRLDLSVLTVTVGTEVIPHGRIRAISSAKKYRGDEDAPAHGYARDVPVAVDVNCGYVVLFGVIAGRPRSELEPMWPEWRAQEALKARDRDRRSHARPLEASDHFRTSR